MHEMQMNLFHKSIDVVTKACVRNIQGHADITAVKQQKVGLLPDEQGLIDFIVASFLAPSSIRSSRTFSGQESQ